MRPLPTRTGSPRPTQTTPPTPGIRRTSGCADHRRSPRLVSLPSVAFGPGAWNQMLGPPPLSIREQPSRPPSSRRDYCEPRASGTRRPVVRMAIPFAHSLRRLQAQHETCARCCRLDVNRREGARDDADGVRKQVAQHPGEQLAVAPHHQAGRRDRKDESLSAGELVLVMIPKGEQRLPRHIAVHPFGKVPVLDDDGFVLYEARAINAYLDPPRPAIRSAVPDLLDGGTRFTARAHDR
jgi:hypothetical protein